LNLKFPPFTHATTAITAAISGFRVALPSARHAEIQMIGHRIGRAGLRLGAADLLLDLAETGFDIPSQTPP